MSQKKANFLNIVKVASFVLFIWFSSHSVKDYFNGKIVFDIINEYNDHLVFPSVTLCPKKKNELIHINLDKLAADQPQHQFGLTSFYVFNTIGTNMSDPFGIVQNYSFNFEELDIRMRISAKSNSDGVLVAPEDFDEALENFTKALTTSQSYFESPPIPIAYRVIEDFRGRCFNFQTKEIATLEPQYQGK